MQAITPETPGLPHHTVARQRNLWILYFFALLKFIIPFFLQNAIYEPHRDELLYLAEGTHMAWGFMEVPPLLSVFAWITQHFGNGFFWIKCWPSLFGALTYLITGKIILSLGGRAFALFLAFLSFIFTGYLRVHFLFQPNFLEIFFWTMIAYALTRYIQSGQNRWLYIFGISAGLGMSSKYSVLFFLVSMTVGLVLTPHRKIFKNKHFYYAALLGFVLFLPNLIWQAVHHFPVVFHMNKLRETQLQYISPASFLSGQLMMLLPCVFIWITGLIFVSASRIGKAYRYIGWAYLMVILILLAGHGKSYYALGAYPVLIAFGAYRLEQLTEKRFIALRFVMVIVPLLMGYWLIPIALPVLPPEQLAAFYQKRHVAKLGVLKWEDGENHPLPQDFADMLGWKETAKKAAAAYATLDSSEKKHTVLFCDNYGLAGAVNFYGREYHLPEAYSDNASFLYWLPDSVHAENVILVTDDPHDMEYPFMKEFVSATLFDSVTNTYARERGDLIIIMKGANDLFRKYFHEKLDKDKAALKMR